MILRNVRYLIGVSWHIGDVYMHQWTGSSLERGWKDTNYDRLSDDILNSKKDVKALRAPENPLGSLWMKFYLRAKWTPQIGEFVMSWWCSQMETFFVLLALCEGNPLVNGGFPSLRPVMWSFDVFFDLCLNKWLSKQLRWRWFETPPCSLWRHSNDFYWGSLQNLLRALKISHGQGLSPAPPQKYWLRGVWSVYVSAIHIR